MVRAVAGFRELVEKRIQAAMEEGAFDDLPGRGEPLALDDDPLVPDDMRLAYRILKNAGYVPEELELRREIASVHRMLEETLDGEDRRRAGKRLALLRTRLASSRGERPANLENEYLDRVRRRLEGGSGDG